MTQEEKQLLLADLCARLSYGVRGKVEIEVSTGEYSIESGHLLFTEKEIDVELIGINKDTEDIEVYPLNNNINLDGYNYVIDDFIPYLRPMSSMTEEEHKEYEEWLPDGFNVNTIDWLNAHHFDYRGLIPKGLAIEVTEENNPYKE